MSGRGGGQFIDLEAWKRREHYDLFLQARHPFFNVTVDVDVTSLWQRSRDRSVSFALGASFALLRAANAAEPMRLRLRGTGVWRHDTVGIGTTVLRTDDTFGFARLDFAPTFDEFVRRAAPAVNKAKVPGPLDLMHEDDDLVYHSTLPWLRFTSFNNALPGNDSIPRVVFGKVFADGSSWRMPLGVEVHHALADGLDVARFVAAFESAIAS